MPLIVATSVRELVYHADLLDAFGLGTTAKIQIHVGGRYDDKNESKKRFCETANSLPEHVLHRLVVENDERLYDLGDVLEISSKTKLPVLFDFFHHKLFNRGEPVAEALALVRATWNVGDGLPMTDFSTQKPGARFGSHAISLDRPAFRQLLEETTNFDFDIMLEIKEKEKSALDALCIAQGDSRLVTNRS